MKGISEAGTDLFHERFPMRLDANMSKIPCSSMSMRRQRCRFGGVGVRGTNLTAYFYDGQVKDYGIVGQKGYMENLWNMIDAIRDDAIICCPGGKRALARGRAGKKCASINRTLRFFRSVGFQDADGLLWVPGTIKSVVQVLCDAGNCRTGICRREHALRQTSWKARR